MRPFSFFSTLRRCSQKRSPSRHPAMFLAKGTGDAIANNSGGTRETISDLNGSFRSRYPVSVEEPSFAT